MCDSRKILERTGFHNNIVPVLKSEERMCLRTEVRHVRGGALHSLGKCDLL